MLLRTKRNDTELAFLQRHRMQQAVLQTLLAFCKCTKADSMGSAAATEAPIETHEGERMCLAAA